MTKKRKKRKQPATAPRRVELNKWDIDRAEIAGWFDRIPGDQMTAFQRQSIRNSWEAILRFTESRNQIESLRRKFPKDHSAESGVSPEQQHAIYDATESFFSRYYVTISNIAALTTRWPKVFGQTPVGSMKSFIQWLEKHFDAYGAFSPAEDARRFRALIDHPEQHQAYEWMTVTVYGGPIHVVLYGPASRSGAVPEGAARKEFDDGPGWDIAAPYENFVFNTTALALHACLWQIEQHLAGQPLTSPVVRVWTADADGNQISDPFLPDRDWHGKHISFNGAGPVTVPGTSGPPSDDPITYEGVSYGRTKSETVVG